MNRYEKVWAIRRECIKGSNNKLWNDHGDVVKRVVSQGVAIPTKIGLLDVLLAWKWISEQRAVEESDGDAANVLKEIADRIGALWDKQPDDLIYQSDTCIEYLHHHLCV
jgi:hypothetical protein